MYGSAPLTGTVDIATSTTGVSIGVYGKSVSTGTGYGVMGRAPLYGVYGEASSPGSSAVFGYNLASSGLSQGVSGYTTAPDGSGIKGTNNAASGVAHGVYGVTYSNAGTGVYGQAAAASGTTYGVYGSSSSTQGYGVYGSAPVTGTVGIATATSGVTYGVFGMSASTSGNSAGVYGYNSGLSGSNIGVYAKTDSTGGHAFYGLATASTGTNYGIYVNTNSASGYGGVFNNWAGGIALTARSNAASGDVLRVENSSNTPVFKSSGRRHVYADGSYNCGQGISDAAGDLSEAEIAPCLMDDFPADFAEMLPAARSLEPGDVLVIDPDWQAGSQQQTLPGQCGGCVFQQSLLPGQQPDAG